ncbi:hypothetical protein GCM10011505_28170 [Tistrella bauzanensis]|uniref:HTH tetR-type domain-containing protein n=1 Tax=Tistrella bauzanensis TaxID=657419 RepID=A0ABQ1IM03_9PROT|nr:TetR/AcrR family transcriptional regulator [Tistrella bauzanensis]GGB45272.1 hypothetical protein GCM10011505_28170 [Tistrella bauzanensis]
MRYTDRQKQEARTRLLAAAGRAFRRQGYGGIGVDGLAKEAGVTSGAFYGHFPSKDGAFAEVAMAGLAQLDDSIAALQAAHPADWPERFIDVYLGDRLACALDESCALQSLTPDVMRAGAETRARFEAALGTVIARIACGLTWLAPDLRTDRAVALLALLSGGVTMARSMAGETRRQAIAAGVGAAAIALLERPARPAAPVSPPGI